MTTAPAQRAHHRLNKKTKEFMEGVNFRIQNFRDDINRDIRGLVVFCAISTAIAVLALALSIAAIAQLCTSK